MTGALDLHITCPMHTRRHPPHSCPAVALHESTPTFANAPCPPHKSHAHGIHKHTLFANDDYVELNLY